MKGPSLYQQCKKVQTSFIFAIFRLLIFKVFYKKNILISRRVTINGVSNINIKGNLKVGLRYVGFMHRNDLTYLNVAGQLNFAGNYSIGKGCRLDIGNNAVVSIGKDGYMSANIMMIIMHNLTIGNHCSIGWNTQFLDEDFHSLEYEGKQSADSSIVIGDNVWIGCNCFIYKGTHIPDGCVVAAYSVVKNSFNETNVLIAGNPARIVKRDINWN